MSKIKSGIVMEIKNNRACVMTSGGEFYNVKIQNSKPEVGEIYTGEAVIEMPKFGKIAAAASLIFVLLTGTAAYAYAKPVASITLSNPAVKVEINRWNRIIKTVPLDNNAKNLLSSVNVTNKSLSDGLNTFIDKVHKNESVNINNKKTTNFSGDSEKIVVSVDNRKSNSDVNLSKFEEHASKNNMKVEIKNNDKDTDTSNPGSNNKADKGNNKKSGNQKGNNNKVKNTPTPTPSSTPSTTPSSGDKNTDKGNGNNNGNKNNQHDKGNKK